MESYALSATWAMFGLWKKSEVFRGRYHIIGGLLSGAAGMTPEDLNLANLPARIKDEKNSRDYFCLAQYFRGQNDPALCNVNNWRWRSYVFRVGIRRSAGRRH